MKRYEITLWRFPNGDRGGYEYIRVDAFNKFEARKYVKDNCLTWRSYNYKIVSINEIKKG